MGGNDFEAEGTSKNPILRILLSSLFFAWYGVLGFGIAHDGRLWIDRLAKEEPPAGQLLSLLSVGLYLLGTFLTILTGIFLRNLGVWKAGPLAPAGAGRWGMPLGALLALLPTKEPLLTLGQALYPKLLLGQALTVALLFWASLKAQSPSGKKAP